MTRIDMTAQIPPRLVFVLGMHRSGTSAVTRGLEVLGVELGDRLLPPAKDNQKGFFEDADAHALNVEAMHALGSDWHALAPIEIDLDDPRLDALRPRFASLLRKRLEGRALFALKDPRINVLLPLWQRACADVGVEPSYVITTRHPMSVAESLSSRDGIAAVKSYYLWLDYVASALLHSAGATRLVVSYDLLMREPEPQLRRLATGLKLPFDAAHYAEYEREFLSQDLRHSVFVDEDLERARDLPPGLLEAHRLMERMARDEAQVDSEEARAFFARVRAGLFELRPLLAYATRLDNEARGLRHQLGARDEQIRQLAHLSGTVELLNRVLAERDEGLRLLGETRKASEAIVALMRRIREGLQSEASHAATVAEGLRVQLRGGGVHSAALEGLERSLSRLGPELEALGDVPTALEGAPDSRALVEWTDRLFGLHQSVWGELMAASDALATVAVGSTRELEISRLRLLDSLRDVARRRTQLTQALARLGALESSLARTEAELRHRERVLDQFPHRFVSRLGHMLDPYPGLRSFLTAPLRLIHRLLARA